MSIITNVILAYVLFHYASMIFDFEDKINDSVGKISAAENVIDEILKRPLFYDSPEVRRVLNSIKQTRNEIVAIANSLGMVEEENDNVRNEK